MSWNNYLQPVSDADRAANARIVAESQERLRIAESPWLRFASATQGYASEYIRPKTYADEVATANQVLASRDRQSFPTGDTGLGSFFDGLSGALGNRLSDWASGTTRQATVQQASYAPTGGGTLFGMPPVVVLLGVGAVVYYVTK